MKQKTPPVKLQFWQKACAVLWGAFLVCLAMVCGAVYFWGKEQSYESELSAHLNDQAAMIQQLAKDVSALESRGSSALPALWRVYGQQYEAHQAALEIYENGQQAYSGLSEACIPQARRQELLVQPGQRMRLVYATPAGRRLFIAAALPESLGQIVVVYSADMEPFYRQWEQILQLLCLAGGMAAVVGIRFPEGTGKDTMAEERKLSWDHSDIERVCGFQSRKFTGVNYVFTCIIGAALSALFYAALLPFRGRGIQLIDMFFHGGAEHRSTIPYYTVFLTGWALAIVFVKWKKLQVQRRALEVKILPDDPNFVLSPRTAREILDRMYEKVDSPRRFVLFDRIERALSNLKNLGNISAVAECLNNQAANDDNYLASSYTVLKGFIWAIPVLGFIGTVIGLSTAVGGFGTVVAQGADIEQLKSSLGGVTGGLAVAFETTLIALVAALFVQLVMTFVQNKEELFLDDCADYCHRNLIAKMKNVNLIEPEA